MNDVDVSIILACYNEGPTFGHSVRRIIAACQKLKKTWEIIFVEDKSTDNTLERIKSLQSKIKNSKLVIHSKNQGRGISVSDGIRTSRGKICGFLDVDLEVRENYIPLFVSEIENGADMVVGKRYYEKGFDSILRFIASYVYSFLVAAMIKIPVSDTEAGYKFFRRDKILPVISKVAAKHWFWDTEICARAYWSGLRINQIPVLFVRRRDKKSTVRLVPDTIDYLKNLFFLRREIPKAFR